MAKRPDEPSTIVPTEEDFPRRYALEQTSMSRAEVQSRRVAWAFKTVLTSMAGLMVVVLTITIIMVGVWFVPSKISAREYVDKVLPLMTFVLGYLFGKST
jgi:hypothetical protein